MSGWWSTAVRHPPAGVGWGHATQAGMALPLVLIFAALLGYQAMVALGGAGRVLGQSAALATRQRLLITAERQLAVVRDGLSGLLSAASWDGSCAGSQCFDSRCTGGYCFQGDFPAGTPVARCRLSPVTHSPWADPALDVWETPSRHLSTIQDGNTLLWVVEFRCFTAAAQPLLEVSLRADAPSGERVLLQALWSTAGRHSWRLLSGT